MTTAVISGTLSDFGLAPIADLYPEIEFRPSGPAAGSAGRLLVTEPVRVTPDSVGAFSTAVQVTDELLPVGVHYKLVVRWLDSAGKFVRADHPEWKLFVPAGGGAIADLMRFPFGPGLTITSPTPPPLWVGLAASWLQMDPDDPDNPLNPANTGDYYELEDV
jgi:hypothetical protein